ncbi:MAG: chitosanase [Bacteroidales bacterium]
MLKIIVTSKKLNRRKFIPAKLPEPLGINGTVLQGYTFTGIEVVPVPNPSLGKWYRDADNNFYWGGAVQIVEQIPDPEDVEPDNNLLEQGIIAPLTKRKIEQVVNAFETGSATGKYDLLVKYRDYTDPATNSLMVQITFGRSQTTEFGHLKALIQDYVSSQGTFANDFVSYIGRIGKKPSLATDDVFCNALKKAGNEDVVMKQCQDQLFEQKYYQPAFQWFKTNGFTHPLSLLVIYDSTIHSGSVPKFLRKRFSTAIPVNGGDEKEWITNYVDVRQNWLANHSNSLLHATVYRTKCFKDQISSANWDLSQKVLANGVSIE